MYTTRQFVETGKTVAKDPLVRRTALFFFVVILFGVSFAGCRRRESISLPERRRILPHSGLRFTLLITDEHLAKAVESLSEDWFAQTQSKLIVLPVSDKAVLEMSSLDADGAILSSHLVGPLAERDALAPLPRDELLSAEARWETFFERCRAPEASWNGQIVGVPFGGPVFTLYYREDLFEKLGKTPPSTWDEYLDLAAFLHDRENLENLVPASPMPWCGTIEPLESGWAGLVLLARAAAYRSDSQAAENLFDPRTMEPRIAEPPVVRALTELAAAGEYGPKYPTTYTPERAREAFWLGECAMAVSWPTAAAPLSGIHQGKAVANFAELPGASEYYDPAGDAWLARDEAPGRIPLLGVRGLTGVVSKASSRREGMTELLLWLAAQPWNPPPGAASPKTTLYLDSQANSAESWMERARINPATFDTDAWEPRSERRVEPLVSSEAAANYGRIDRKSVV